MSTTDSQALSAVGHGPSRSIGGKIMQHALSFIRTVTGRLAVAALVAGCMIAGACPAVAQSSGTPSSEGERPDAASERGAGYRAKQTARFLAGAALGLAAHESGHLAFDGLFSAGVSFQKVEFGSLPFFAIMHHGGQSARREYAISSAGFLTQHASNELLLLRHPGLRQERSPLRKGVFTFNVLLSIGYAATAFARAGPFQRDTRSMAASLGVDERWVGAMVIAPALLDAYRYFHPESRWARWASRAAKAGMIFAVVR